MQRTIMGIWGLMLVVCLLPLTAQAQDVTGDWKGLLKTGAIDLRVVIHLKADAGAYSGKIDFLDQGMKGIAVSKVQFAENELSFAMETATYKGQLQANGTITGQFLQAGNAMALDFERGEWKINRPQEPKGPFPYAVTDVTYPNPAVDGVTLAGTLTIPDGCQHCPVAILITGSGPQNRDEELLMHKPFWVLADDLSRHGIAVLRVDDRGVAASTGKYVMATSADFASDVLAGVNYLKGRRDLPLGKIGLIGHSEGGMIAPMVAAQSADVGFIALLAGTGVRGDILLAEQTRLVMRASGASEAEISKSHKTNADIYAIIVKSKTMKQAKAKIEGYMEKVGKTDSTITKDFTKGMIAQINNIWFRYFLKYDPAPTLTKVKCPVLALNGDKDVQVPADMNLDAIAAALKKGGNADFKILKVPGLNHLFQHCTTCSVNEYGILEETFAPEAMQALREWILEKGK